MSNQFLAATGGSPIEIDPNTAEVYLADALQGQKMYFDGTGWQFRAEYGDHDYVIGTEAGDYANLQAVITAAGSPIFPTTQQTLKVFIKNSVTEPAAIVVPANSRFLVTVGPGVEYTFTNTISLTGTGSATQPTSLIFVGQAPQSSTVRWDRPSGGFLITKTGANRVRFECRNIRVLKAQVVNVGSTATLVDPSATLIRQIYDRVAFLVGGDSDGYLGNSAGTSAVVDARITRCTIDSSINPITGTASNMTNVLRSSSANSNIYVDELTIVTATAVNGTILNISDGSNSTYRNIQIANDALNTGNNSNIFFNCRFVQNITQINTIGVSNVTFNIDSPLTPAVPQGARYADISCTTFGINKQDAGGSFQRATLDNISVTNLLLTAPSAAATAIADSTLSNITCGVFLMDANFGILRTVINRLSILTTANPFEALVSDCIFLSPRIIDAANGFIFRGARCVISDVTCTGPLTFTLAFRTVIRDSHGTTMAVGAITVGDTGNVVENCKGFTAPLSIVNNTGAAAKENVHIDKCYTAATVLTITTTSALTQIHVTNSRFGSCTVSSNIGAGITNCVKFYNTRFETAAVTNTITGSNISCVGCFFNSPIVHTGIRSFYSQTEIAPFTGMGLTMIDGTLATLSGMQIQSTDGITIGTTNSVQMSNVRCTNAAGNITFTDAAGSSYQLSNCRCNSIVFQGGQTFTIVTGCRTTLALPVAATTAAGNVVG